MEYFSWMLIILAEFCYCNLAVKFKSQTNQLFQDIIMLKSFHTNWYSSGKKLQLERQRLKITLFGINKHTNKSQIYPII